MKDQRIVRAQGRKLVMGLVMSGLIALVAQGGCASSDTPEFILLPDAGNGTGNNPGSGGTTNTGTGGTSNTGTGGTSATGGTFGTGGVTETGGTTGSGGTRASGGTTGSGGTRASGGTTGSGGTVGSGGTTATGGMGGARATGGTTGSGGTRATGGTTGSGGSGGAAAPTFTQIYQTILTVYCAGSQCHNPGSQSGVSFSSQSNAYNAAKSRVTAGNANGSSFYTIISSGRMPPSGSKPSSAQIAQIAAWINAGALNN